MPLLDYPDLPFIVSDNAKIKPRTGGEAKDASPEALLTVILIKEIQALAETLKPSSTHTTKTKSSSTTPS
jgi:hypothetical protein